MSARIAATRRQQARRLAGLFKPRPPMRIIDAGFHSDRSIRELTHRRQPLMLIVVAALALGASVSGAIATYHACRIAPVTYVQVMQ